MCWRLKTSTLVDTVSELVDIMLLKKFSTVQIADLLPLLFYLCIVAAETLKIVISGGRDHHDLVAISLLVHTLSCGPCVHTTL